MNRSKDYPGFWHAVLLCVIFIALQLVLVIPVAISDAVFKTRLVAHPAVLGGEKAKQRFDERAFTRAVRSQQTHCAGRECRPPIMRSAGIA